MSTTQVCDCTAGTVTMRALTTDEQTALTSAQQAAQMLTSQQAAIQTAQQQDMTSRAALIQQAQAAYQQLQTDISGWSGMTTAQKLDAMARTMQALALTMQVEAAIARIMQRAGD